MNYANKDLYIGEWYDGNRDGKGNDNYKYQERANIKMEINTKENGEMTRKMDKVL